MYIDNQLVNQFSLGSLLSMIRMINSNPNPNDCQIVRVLLRLIGFSDNSILNNLKIMTNLTQTTDN